MTRARFAAPMFALLLATLPAAAHQLTVFATVADGVVRIEATFANGTPVKAGTLRILDAQEAVIHEALLDGTAPILFPVGSHTDGMTIEVDAGGGHANYWVLTPKDLAGE